MTSSIQDPEFPGLSAALDVERVLDALASALPECRNGTRLLDGSVVDVRYRPGGPCWVLYHLKLRHGDERSTRQLVSGRVLRVGESPERPPEALVERYRQRVDRGLHTPVVALPDLPMLVYAFPVDASLPGLFDASDGSALRARLGVLWQDRRVRVRRVRVRRLGYTPHARAAFAYEVLNEARGSGVPELRRLVGKMHAKKEPARLFADAWALWRMARGRVNLAPPVGYLPGVGLSLQEMVPGERLGGLVEDPRFMGWARRVGRMLAELHLVEAPLSSRRRPPEEAQTIHRWAGVLRAIRPDLAPRVDRLRDRLAAEVLARAEATAPIHADFHHTNVLVDGDELTFIDLDEAAIGDPMLDVGRFLASLRIPARRAFGEMGGLQEAGESFLEAYLRRRPADQRVARLFEASSLLIAAASAFRIQRATWVEEVAELVGESERVLQQACRGDAVGGPGAARQNAGTRQSGGKHRDAAKLRWIRDGIYMQATLAPHLRRIYGAEATRCRVRPANGGKDAQVGYEIRSPGSRTDRLLRGEVRLTRGGRAAADRLEAAWAMLESDPTGLRLPRPVAYLGGLSLLVWDPPDGESLADLADSPEALIVVEALARGLAVLHEAPLEFGLAPRSLDEELQRLGSRAADVASQQADIATAVTAMVEAAHRAADRLPVRFGPALRTVAPGHLVWNGSRVGLDRVEDVVVAHPLGDVADFVARCLVLAARNGPAWAWGDLARRFRETYLATTAEDPNDLAVFETIALLRLTCGRARRGPDAEPGLARHLLELAETRLVGGGFSG